MVSFIFFVSNKMCSCRNQFFYSFFIYISFKSELNLNSENYFFDVNANLLCQIKSFIFLFILILNKAIFFCQDMSCSLFHFTYNCHLCFFVVFQIKKKKNKKKCSLYLQFDKGEQYLRALFYNHSKQFEHYKSQK